MLPTMLYDVLKVILGHLEKRSDVINVGLVCKRLLPLAIRTIYREVVLHGPACESVVQLLARSPNAAIHVHNLELHAEESHRIEGPKLSLLIAQLTRASMYNLRKFIWNVPTAQQRDDMWYSLRRHCPLLKSIGTCFGVHVPSPSGSFFRFTDLRELNVIYRPTGANSATVKASIGTLWQVMQQNSPNLEVVVLTGIGSTDEGAASVQRMLQCRWPSSLKRVCFQNLPVEIGSASRAGLHPGANPLFAFLTEHPELQEVIMPSAKNFTQPTMFTDLPHYALRRLEIFEGTIMQLTTMHGIAGLQSLRVTEPLDNWENSIGTITTALKDIRNLHIIRLAWRTHDPSLSWSNLCSLLVCCPHLTDLDLTLSGQPLLSWDNFRGLFAQCTPRLVRLRLATTQHSDDQAMIDGARQLALTIPSLTLIRLRYLSLTDLHVPSSPSYIEHGDYEVIRTGLQQDIIIHAECFLVDLMSTKRLSQRTVKGVTQQWYQARGALWCKQGPFRVSLDPSASARHSRTSSLSLLSHILRRGKISKTESRRDAQTIVSAT